MVRLISRQRGGLAALKLTKLFGIDDFPAAKDSGKVLLIIIYCYLIIIIIIIIYFLFKSPCERSARETRYRDIVTAIIYCYITTLRET